MGQVSPTCVYSYIFDKIMCLHVRVCILYLCFLPQTLNLEALNLNLTLHVIA